MTDRAKQRQMLLQSLTDYQMSLLKDGERLDDLYRCGLKLIQQPRYFCIGSDSVLLADFAEILPREDVLDVGCGNGGMTLLLYVKCPQAHYTGVEVMANCADLARRNVLLNGLAKDIAIIDGDFRGLADGGKKYDKIICNPPYMPLSSKRLSSVAERAAARFELNGTLADFFRTARAVLRVDGSFNLVVPSARDDEVCRIAAENGFFCRRRQAVWAADGGRCLLTLWEFVLNFCQTAVLADISIAAADEVCKKHWPESCLHGKGGGEPPEK